MLCTHKTTILCQFGLIICHQFTNSYLHQFSSIFGGNCITELVGVDDCMPKILWTQYFLEAQGYQIQDSVVYQDNQSAMLLANNGLASSSKRTRHMNIRYFFVTDRIQVGDIRVAYCPTDDMVADFFTKPLQGSKFTHFCDQILNVQSEPNVTTTSAQRSVLGNDVQVDDPQRGCPGAPRPEQHPVVTDTPEKGPRCSDHIE